MANSQQQSWIPFRYTHTGADLSDSFSQSQQIPYEKQSNDSFSQRNFIDPRFKQRNTNYLGTGSREDYSVNRSLMAVQNKDHPEWMVYGPTPKQLLALPQYDDFWVNQGGVTQGQLNLTPSNMF